MPEKGPGPELGFRCLGASGLCQAQTRLAADCPDIICPLAEMQVRAGDRASPDTGQKAEAEDNQKVLNVSPQDN